MGWSRFFRRRYWDEERARELDAHLAHEIDDNLARGMRPDAARAAAYRKFGNPTLVREEIYEMNSLGFLETLWQDLRYGARLLRRNPTFAAVAVVTLALGTGANTAMFQLVDTLRLRTLPVQRPDRLAELRIDTHDKGRTGRFLSNRPLMTEPLFRRIAENQQAFSSLLAYGSVALDLATGGESQPVSGMWVDGGYFATLGVHARIGRVFTPADDRPGCGAPGAVLSDAFFHRHFGGDPGAIGRVLSLDGHPFTIIGVTPPSFFGVEVGRTFDVALPLCAEPLVTGERSGIGKADVWFLDVLGRLKPGWTAAQASAHLAAISAPIFKATLPGQFDPADQRDYLAFTLTAQPAATGVSSMRGDYATPLWVLLGATAVVLLVACANLANLLLARASARHREIAVRLALGASRRRVVRQLLSESLLIALLGAAGGLAVASWFSRTLVAFLDTRGNRIFLDVSTDWRVFAFAFTVATAAALLFGMLPALRATRESLSSAMKIGGRGTIDGRGRFGLRRVLVVVQVALSLVLIAGAVLLGSTYRNLSTEDPGFRDDGIIVASLDLRGTGAAPANRKAFNDRIAERLAAIPGVDGVAQTFIVPLGGSGWNNRVTVDGQPKPGNVNLNQVSAGYFSVLRTPLVAGRAFDARRDTPETEPVAIVNQAFVRKFLDGAPAVGRTFGAGGRGTPRIYRIVGVAANTKYSDLREGDTPIAYFAESQQTVGDLFPSFLLHTALPAEEVTTAATAAIGDVHPGILVQYQMLTDQIAETLVSERLMATLSLCLGVLAIVIATVGLYGVMSYIVARRRAEIGLRLALGAERSSVVAMIVREAGLLLVVGAGIGAALSVAAGRAVASLLYGLEPWDPAALAASIGMLATVSLLASWIPARRAARVSPTVALRED